jgi:hypothetical protein
LFGEHRPRCDSSRGEADAGKVSHRPSRWIELSSVDGFSLAGWLYGLQSAEEGEPRRFYWACQLGKR